MSLSATAAGEERSREKQRGPRMPALALGVLLVVASLALAVVAARGQPPPRTMQERVRAVASGLRCPVCQGLSVADSPSALASQMRASIARDLKSGRTPAEIRARFVASYGEWISLSPERRGFNILVWLLPFLLLLAGVGLTLAAIRRWRGEGSTVVVDDGGARSAGSPGSVAGLLAEGDRELLEGALARLEEEEPE